MNTIHKLTEYFSKLPGIGPRQSKRFVYFLLSRDNVFLEELSKLIISLKKDVSICRSCFRYFPSNHNTSTKICDVCSNKNRDNSVLMIVEKDSDFENVEKTNTYNGFYFILGGTLPILERDPNKKIRIIELMKKVESNRKENKLAEIIIATGLSTEGENTKDYLVSKLKPISEKNKIKLSLLGRGLSTGTELEYIDTETIKNALQNRH